MFQSDFQIKKAKEFLKLGSKILEGEVFSDEDRQFFKDSKKANLAAEALIGEEEVDKEKKMLLLIQYIQLCNKLMFLVFRKGKYSDLEESYRNLISIDEVAKGYETYTKRNSEEQDKIQALINEQQARQHKLDVFKGVLNGMSVEDAEARLSQYENQVKQAVQEK